MSENEKQPSENVSTATGTSEQSTDVGNTQAELTQATAEAPKQPQQQPKQQPQQQQQPKQQPQQQPKPQPAPVVAPVESMTVVGKNIILEIEAYMELMKPRMPVAEAVGARNQVTLYRAIVRAINVLNDDFGAVFSKILELFEKDRDGCFSEIYLFRFMEHVQLPTNDRKAMTRLFNLLKLAAPIKGREFALKQVDLIQTTEFAITEQGRQRVMNFFGK